MGNKLGSIRKPVDQKKSRQICVKVTEEEERQLREMAASKHIPLASYFRLAIFSFYNYEKEHKIENMEEYHKQLTF